MAYKVFISHASTDTWVARQIESHVKQSGADTFLDASVIESGDKFEDEIFEALPDSDEIFVLFTPWSIERLYVWMEIGAGIAFKKRVVIVLYGITKEEIALNPKMPDSVKSRDIIEINELEKYFGQLRERIISKNK